MSVQTITWALSVTTGSPAKKAILLAIANYADEHGVAWPSQEALAKDTEYSKRAVLKALADLEEMKLLTRQRRYGKNGYRTSDLIVLSLGEPYSHEADSPEPYSREPERESYVHQVHSKNKPSIEPSIKSPPPRARATRIPPNFALEEKYRRRAQSELGFSEQRIDDEMESMKECFNARAGPKALHVNWQRVAWDWLKRALKFDGKEENGGRRQSRRANSITDVFDNIYRELDERERAENDRDGGKTVEVIPRLRQGP